VSPGTFLKNKTYKYNS